MNYGAQRHRIFTERNSRIDFYIGRSVDLNNERRLVKQDSHFRFGER